MPAKFEPGCSTLDRRPRIASVTVGRLAKVKALEPVTSTAPPSLAQITEISRQGIMLRVQRYMAVGTIVQLHLDGEFSLWKIICCVAVGKTFHLGLEFVEPVSPIF